jgi:5-methylthioribose kinase
MMMEDLGEGSDYTALYKKDVQLKENELEELIAFIAHLHKNFNKQNCKETITNREMRALNHEHIFVLPFEKDNGLNLDDIVPGLAEVSNLATNNSKLKEAVKSLGQQYLEDGAQLLHGDYFPGSWLKTVNGIKIIDPEFCFFGPAEFELGVCLAHLYMAEQPKEFIQKAINIYKKDAPLNDMLMMKFMAVEMLRRILGVAQLPLQLSLNERKALVERSILIITEY